ncbi:hypothetical protein DEIPH_ctg025orf0266 [Deinococcus phoenicis]|uniref:PDZ domain-containing protein n=1 Tax=Deinococcus phoenicis TaxID=1476583 RepID=A0A016QRG6_9DEIO|nr:hypothetical protein DEIPH_ctg025orf0266 [Deinococcus phoenicis]
MYLKEALEIIRREALHADRVDWVQVTHECQVMCAGAQAEAAVFPAIRHALAALRDGHSHLRLPDAGTVHRGIIGLYFTGGVIALVLPGSPADLAGLRPGDHILSLQGQPVGPGVNEGLLPDAALTFEVERAGKRQGLTLTREDAPAVPPDPQGRLIAPGTGLVTLPDCDLGGTLTGGRPYQDRVRDILLDLSARGASRWVVDLRLNLGGNMWPMLAGIGPLAGEGELGAFVKGEERWPWCYARGEASIGGEVLSRTPGTLPPLPDTVPVAVLTSPLTASSGEIITLSFLGRRGTRLFGEPTRGLTTSNSLYELPGGASLLITTALDADRTGRVFAGPVEPDVPTGTDWAEFQTAKDPVLNAALDWLGRT